MPLWKVFSVEYHFKIPHYQRPYAWETTQAADLLNDLSDALDRDSAEPYFLGSLVLIKQREVAESQVIDGQQRLTTLTILFAVLAELARDADVGDLFRKLISGAG